MNADQVRFIRSVFKLSQRDLAKALNVTPPTVARWEMAPDADGGHAPTGLQAEVLRGLHNVALKVHADNNPQAQQMVAGLIVLGIGALIAYLLANEIA